ncbi:MAG: restriction endonuclease [Casimicrobiaceae bacterium]
MLEPREGSLFAILSRSPWWVSLLIAGGLFALARIFLPDLLAAATTLPFLGLAGYAAWLQSKEPSAKLVDATLEKLRAMRWPEFAAMIGDSFRRDGYEVTTSTSAAADLLLRKNGYVTLVCAKRWKVAQCGVPPLRDLADAIRATEARDGCFVTAGALTESAAQFAVQHGLRVIHGAELVKILRRVPAGTR